MSRSRHTGFELKQLTNLIFRRMTNGSEHPSHATAMQGVISGFIYHHMDEDVFQRDVEREFHIRRSTATGILQLMEKRGLVRRSPVAYDARLKKLTLTQAAIDQQQAIAQRFDDIDQLLERGSSPEELAVFYRVLDRMRKNVE